MDEPSLFGTTTNAARAAATGCGEIFRSRCRDAVARSDPSAAPFSKRAWRECAVASAVDPAYLIPKITIDSTLKNGEIVSALIFSPPKLKSGLRTLKACTRLREID